ncbi:MAG: AEC family transporter, partial [Firmicutes bacterium]|nr:AEC family transporter [Bacillota bacterium]
LPFFRIIIVVMLIAGSSWIFSRILGHVVLHLTPANQSGLDLISVFSNASNLGIPVVLFALGPGALPIAVIVVLWQTILINTFGAYLAGQHALPPAQIFRRISHLPAIWAMLAAAVLRVLPIGMPLFLNRAAALGANAYAPTVLVVLGLNIAGISLKKMPGSAVLGGIALRLFLLPSLALLFTRWLNLPDLVSMVIVLQIAMPAAVNTLILLQEFDSASSLVSQTVLWSTLFSLVTIPVWLLAL